MTRVWFGTKVAAPIGIGLKAIGLAAVAVAGLAAGAALAESTRNLRAVAITHWTPDHRTAAGETQVVAQIDFSTQLMLRDQGEFAFVMPLLAPNATEDDSAVYGAIIYPGLRTLDDARLDALLETTLGMGPRGPVVKLSAAHLAPGAYSAQLAQAMASQGRSMSRIAPMLQRIDPPTPGIAWMPILASSAAVLIVLALAMRIFTRGASATAELGAGRHHILPGYVPELANGADGALALARVIGPHEVRRDAASAKSRLSRAASRTPVNPLFVAARLSENWSEGLKLSGRALTRLNADPFVQRLGRLN